MLDRLVHGSAFWGWRVGASLAQRLPSWITYPAAVVGGEIAYVFWTGRRRIAKQNFAVVLALPADDREVARVARRSFRNFAKYLVEIMRFPRLESADFAKLVTVDPRSWSYFRAARDHGRGLIFVSMHFGNFEFGCADRRRGGDAGARQHFSRGRSPADLRRTDKAGRPRHRAHHAGDRSRP